MKKIIILDFESGKCHVYSLVGTLKDMESENIVIKLGFSPTNCQWMLTREAITIN